ncbi:DUF998 domain-containing protein (plasmid) [Embleya sp. NBC_00888]|uniref:DUF998 domain-containing protein n=1 Tax=Embleya sp. NBC_00888 TaxID=2975960 RepID=UPI002F90F7A0|nr:DUF998 domain-containing protein [Embleya sp. NBC_00888]
MFFAPAGVQMATREGFDITRHPISQLSTGGAGWIQVTTFVLAGLGALALAAGIARALTEGVGRRTVPVLVAVFGVGMISTGLFAMDAENGFPVGTPDRPVEHMSWHSIVHSASAVGARLPAGPHHRRVRVHLMPRVQGQSSTDRRLQRTRRLLGPDHPGGGQPDPASAGGPVPSRDAVG